MATAHRRLRLTFPPGLIQEPVVYHLVRDFDVVANVRRAEVENDHGCLLLELDGAEDALDRGIAWLEARGVRVDPVGHDGIVP